MKRMTSAAVIAASAAAIGFGQAATANAAPAPPVHYQAHIEGQKVVLTTDAGDIVTQNGQLQIRDANKKVISSLPLSYIVGDKQLPIGAQAAGRKVTLVPSTDAAKAQPAPPGYLNADPNGYVTKQQRDDAALGRLGQQVSVPASVGGLIGTIIGAGIGCVVTLPAACIGGLVTGAGVGGVIGTVVAGGPALAIAFDNYNKTVNAPFIKTQHI